MKKLVLSGFAFAFLSSGALASPFAYATNYVQDLLQIDLNSPATVLIGNIGFAAQELAQTSSGQLFATNNTGKLFNVTGAIVTPVANLGSLSVGSMDSTGSTLWGYDNASQRLFEYDPIATSFVQWSPVLGLSNVNALCIDSNGEFLFVDAVGSVDKFGKITNGTWGVSLINPNMGLQDHCEAMDFLADGNLYAVVLQDYRYQINPLTGAAISGFNSGTHRDWADMTGPTSVPEPSSLMVLGMGLWLVRRRKTA